MKKAICFVLALVFVFLLGTTVSADPLPTIDETLRTADPGQITEVSDNLDDYSVLNEALEDLTELTFDLRETAYISSAGLRILLIAQKRMNKQGKMTVTNANSDLMDILEVTGFTDILTIE